MRLKLVKVIFYFVINFFICCNFFNHFMIKLLYYIGKIAATDELSREPAIISITISVKTLEIYHNTVYHESFVAGNFRRFRCFSYHRESFMPNNLHHRHNPWVHHEQPQMFYDEIITCHGAAKVSCYMVIYIL